MGCGSMQCASTQRQMLPRLIRIHQRLSPVRQKSLRRRPAGTTVAWSTWPAWPTWSAWPTWRVRRTHCGKGFELIGGEDLVELGLDVLLKSGDLLLLIGGEVQFRANEGGQDMDAARGAMGRGRGGRCIFAGTGVSLHRRSAGRFLRRREEQTSCPWPCPS